MTKEMTSRERVYATLNHEEPDRVPIDFGGTFCSSINAVAYGRLKKHLGITCPTYVRHIIAMLAATDLDDGLEIMKIMGSDVVEFPYNFWSDWKDGLPVGGPVDDTMAFPLRGGVECIIPPHPQPILRDNGDWEMEAKGIPIFRMPKDGHYFDRIFYPLSSVDNTKKLEEVMPAMANNAFFRPLKADYLDLLSRYARNIHEQTDFFVMANMHSYLSLWQFPCLDIFGYESFFMIMATDPELVHRWMEFITGMIEERIRTYLGAVGRYIDGIIIADDFGTQKGLQISRNMFQEQIKPYLTRICTLIHETCPHLKILFHSCGSVTPLIPDLIEAGIDALNPVQTTARDMDASMLKREFGDQLTYWGGGVSSQTTLFKGTVEEVEAEVKEKMEIFKPGGGYVFTADHDIQEHVLPEKILAAFQTAQKYREY